MRAGGATRTTRRLVIGDSTGAGGGGGAGGGVGVDVGTGVGVGIGGLAIFSPFSASPKPIGVGGLLWWSGY